MAQEGEGRRGDWLWKGTRLPVGSWVLILGSHSRALYPGQGDLTGECLMRVPGDRGSLGGCQVPRTMGMYPTVRVWLEQH